MINIIIPVYLSDPLHQEFTQETIDSIKTKHIYHIYLINNHTSPEFQPFVADLDSKDYITVLDNPKGNSLSAAWNLGIKESFDPSPLIKGRLGRVENSANDYSQSTNNAPARLKPKTSNLTPTKYCLIINNDIVFHPDAIDNLITFAQEHPQYLLWSGVEHHNLRTLHDSNSDNSHSHHPHFSCFMITQKTIDIVGYFDENLDTAYFEDNDYHIRILQAGFQAAATTTARFYHYGSRTAAVDEDLRLKLKPFYQKNRQYMKKKWGIDLHGKGFSPPEAILNEIYPNPFNDSKKTIKDW